MIPTWFREAIGYEIYPQSFMDSNGDGIGDFQGIVDKLDYVRGLGCNLIWLNPCFDSPMQDAGYDVRDYRKTAERYGTNEELESLIATAHEKGMRVLLDLVPGHTSIEHEWFRKSQESEHNELSDRFIWSSSVWDKPKDYYWISGLTERDGCAMVNFFNSQPALNYGFANVTLPWQMSYTDERVQATFDAILDVMRFWLKKGCDGFRVDMAGSLVKDDPTGEATASLWQRAQEMLRREYPDAVMISEWSDPEKAVKLAGFQGDFYLVFNAEGYLSLMRSGKSSYFHKEAAGDFNIFLNEYTKRYAATKQDGFICFVTGNHDEDRAAKEFDTSELKLCYAFLMTMPGVPFVYAGDEIGMKHLPLPDKEGGYNRTGARTPIQWSRERNFGFSSAPESQLYLPQDPRADAPNVDTQMKEPDSLWSFLHRVLELRASERALRADSSFESVYVGEKGYPYVYRRGDLLLAMNVTTEDKTIPLAVGEPVFLHGSVRPSNGVADSTVLAAQTFVVWRA